MIDDREEQRFLVLWRLRLEVALDGKGVITHRPIIPIHRKIYWQSSRGTHRHLAVAKALAGF